MTNLESKSKLFLLDGMALAYRAHFGMIKNPMINSKDINTSAVYGFTNYLVELLQKQKPTHMAVVFDTYAPTVRHKYFPKYKAGRDEMPEDLQVGIPMIKEIVKAFNIKLLELDGYEADDIIGTLVKRFEHEKIDNEPVISYMVTPDKDFAQLVSDTTLLYKPSRFGSGVSILGVDDIKEKWLVQSPQQVVDILGLWGDSADNIPGVPGIGEKTSKKLIGIYGSIESLLENTDDLKGKQKENVINFSEQAMLSKKLAQIILDVPIKAEIIELKIEQKNESKLTELFQELEFNTLGKRILGSNFSTTPQTIPIVYPTNLQPLSSSVSNKGIQTQLDLGFQNPANGNEVSSLKNLNTTNHEYHLVRADDEEIREIVLNKFKKLNSFCFDCETTGLDVKNDKIVGLALCEERAKSYYIEIPQDEEGYRKVLDEIQEILSSEDAEKIGHNLKFDLSILAWNNVKVSPPYFDTMILHYFVDPSARKSMDYLSVQYLNYKTVPISDIIGEKSTKSKQLTMLEAMAINPELVSDYAAEDADITWQLSTTFRNLIKDKWQEKILRHIEFPLLPVLIRMETEGIRIDPNLLSEISVELDSEILSLQSKIYKDANMEFNLNSPKQLGEVLFKHLKLVEKPSKTATGQYKTDEQTLEKLSSHHVIIKDILEYRKAAKLKSTYVDALPKNILPKTGRVHTTFHQLAAITGRLASDNPNLQNIPIRSERGKEIRKAFVPHTSDDVLLCADYSQVELRVMAHLSQDPSMMQAFNNQQDIHTATAAKVYNVKQEEVNPDMRSKAKMVNFGIIYGISAFGLSQRLNIPRKEAGTIIDEYFRQYPKVKNYMEDVVHQAKTKGYVETITGRRRYLRDITSRNANISNAAERVAINTPVQGSAADMIKIAMINIDKMLTAKNFKTKMLLQVHDELVFNVPKSEVEIVKPLITSFMQDAVKLSVPIIVDVGIGNNWLEAH